MSNLKEFTAGGLGGLSLLAVGHPFDTIKVRIQTKPNLYPTAATALKLTIAQEGPFAIYKGVSALVPTITPYMALNFLGYSQGKKIFSEENFSNYFAAGFVSGFYTFPVIGPAERVKCVAQTIKSSPNQKTTSFTIAKSLYQQGGTTSLLKGLEFTFLRETIGSAFYFSTYEFLKQNYLQRNNLKNHEFPVLYNLLFGGLGGMAMWATVMPFDVIKNRIQISEHGVSRGDVLGEISKEIRRDGLKVLFRGLGVALLRAFPANAACFVGYEQGRRWYDEITCVS